MKCPKCDYLSFDESERCRNCGYEFVLARPAADPAFDLPLSLADAEPLLPSVDSPGGARPSLDLNRIIGTTPADLPLFADASGSDKPLVTPSQPRAPLGVRRSTPEVPRARVRAKSTDQARPGEASLSGLDRDTVNSAGEGGPAAAVSRAAAAFIDGAMLMTLDAIVIYLTLRLCGLAFFEVMDLPLVPLAAFLLLLDGGYFVAFTAVGGQSIGKMALGIKVVGEEDRPVPFGQATVRTLAYLVSALPLGAGFAGAFLGADRLALHDRLAHTRVVRPSAL
jgi:uncharacterized RDD family membrane protein YckC